MKTVSTTLEATRTWLFTPPPGTSVLRELMREDNAKAADAVSAVVHAARDGQDVTMAAEAGQVTWQEARDIVATVGAAIGQALKRRSAKTEDILEAGRGRRAGYEPGSIHKGENGYIVVAAEGWAGKGRDIRRSYAQVMLADETSVKAAIARVKASEQPTSPTRAHYRDCWLAATTDWFTLGDLATTQTAAATYLAAVENLEQTLGEAVLAVDHLVDNGLSDESLSQAILKAQSGWWLLPDYANAHRTARHEPGSPWLTAWFNRVRATHRNEPDVLRPHNLAQLTRVQMDALILTCNPEEPV